MTMRELIEKILSEEYEDQCRHDRGTTWVIPSENAYDCEGGTIKVICSAYKQEFSEGVMYE